MYSACTIPSAKCALDHDLARFLAHWLLLWNYPDPFRTLIYIVMLFNSAHQRRRTAYYHFLHVRIIDERPSDRFLGKERYTLWKKASIGGMISKSLRS